MLLEDQDRSLWNRELIGEGLTLIEKALRHHRPGPYQIQAAIAGVHAHALRPEDTDWAEIDQLYAVLERLQPSPVVSLNRAVAVAKLRGAAAALPMIEPLAGALGGYFHFFGVKGALLMQLVHATLIKHNLPDSTAQMVQAAIIVVAVYVARERSSQ